MLVLTRPVDHLLGAAVAPHVGRIRRVGDDRLVTSVVVADGVGPGQDVLAQEGQKLGIARSDADQRDSQGTG